MIEQEAVIEDNNNPQRERTLTRSSRMSRQSPSTGRPLSPLRLRRGSGTGSSSTASPMLRTTRASRTPASRTTAKPAATNQALLLASGSKRILMTDYSTEERLNEYAESNLDLLIKLD